MTIYGGIAYRENKQCPRCEADMSESPRPLFRSFTLDGARPKPPPDGHPPQFAGR